MPYVSVFSNALLCYRGIKSLSIHIFAKLAYLSSSSTLPSSSYLSVIRRPRARIRVARERSEVHLDTLGALLRRRGIAFSRVHKHPGRGNRGGGGEDGVGSWILTAWLSLSLVLWVVSHLHRETSSPRSTRNVRRANYGRSYGKREGAL